MTCFEDPCSLSSLCLLCYSVESKEIFFLDNVVKACVTRNDLSVSSSDPTLTGLDEVCRCFLWWFFGRVNVWVLEAMRGSNTSL